MPLKDSSRLKKDTQEYLKKKFLEPLLVSPR